MAIKISVDEYRRLLLKENNKGTITIPDCNKNQMAVPKNKKLTNYQHASNKAWRTIAGRKIFFRSSWEFNYALYLQWLKDKKEIIDWEHEPEIFEFPIKHGTTRYLPDFKVVISNSKKEYHEVKGYLDNKSKTKIKRFRKYYPDEQLIIIYNFSTGITNINSNYIFISFTH